MPGGEPEPGSGGKGILFPLQAPPWFLFWPDLAWRLPALAFHCLDGADAGSCAFNRLVPESRKSRRWLREKQGWVLDSLFLPSEGLFSNMVCIILIFGALGIVGIGGEVEEVGILSRAGGVEKVFHHDQGAVVGVESYRSEINDRTRCLSTFAGRPSVQV